MGASYSRALGAPDSPDRSALRDHSPPSEPPPRAGMRRGREPESDSEAPPPRRRRLALRPLRRLRAGWGARAATVSDASDEDMHMDAPPAQPSTAATSAEAPATPSAPGPSAEPPQEGAPAADPLASERAEAVRLIESVLGRRPPPAAEHPRLDPTTLRGSHGPRSRAAEAPRPALGTLLNEVMNASRSNQGAQPPQLSGTSVIVQGALVARTARRPHDRDGAQSPSDAPTPADHSPAAAHSDALPPHESLPFLGPRMPPNEAPPSDTPPTEANGTHVASLEEQGEMLGRILRIATAATAASLVSGPPQPPSAAMPAGSSRRAGQELLERLASLSGRRTPREGSGHAPGEPDTVSTISQLMREALRASMPSARAAPPEPTTVQPAATSVLTSLEQARQGQPLAVGAPGSFERFLYDLIHDLGAAISQIDTGDGAEPPPVEASEEERARRDGDLSARQLSFFRLFRFERNPESSLIPCVLIGVRSLRADERIIGTPEPQADAQAGVSRFVLFVSGGRYHDTHPLLTARARDAGRDIMFMMELLGTMAALSSKPPTASASDIARSGLVKVRASELASLRESGRVTENTSEKCLVCLDEWQPEDECRILSCKHAFHATCVDKWLEQSSNSCPLCTCGDSMY